MRPVSNQFPTSQDFGSGATQGVVANSNPNSGMGYYVWLYGNYQPFGHAGLDIACPVGTPIYAPADGTVLYSGWTEDLPGAPASVRKWLFYYNFGGILTVIQHNGWISAIAHQSNNDAVHPGMKVKEGQLIGKSGNTKTRTTTVAAHAHIEALVHMDYRTDVRNGIIYGRVDPMNFFGGMAAMGTITTEQEWTDMASAAEVEEASFKGALRALEWKVDNTVGGKTSVLDVARVVDQRFNEAPDALLDTKTDRYGEFGGQTSLRGHLAYADQKHIEDLRASALAAHGDGVSADQIIQAVRDALASGVKVEATVKVGE